MGDMQNNFIEKARKVHGDKYDYSKVKYVDSKTKVCIICPEHGEFWQTPTNHLKGYEGCKICFAQSNKKRNLKTLEQFVKDAINIHGDKYDYSKVEYFGKEIKICIICPEHGEFWQTPGSHLRGCGCPICAGRFIDTDIFIKRSRKVHGDKYDYSKVKYVDSKTKVCIICPEHGEFEQKPCHHLVGAGCKLCGMKRVSKKIPTL